MRPLSPPTALELERRACWWGYLATTLAAVALGCVAALLLDACGVTL